MKKQRQYKEIHLPKARPPHLKVSGKYVCLGYLLTFEWPLLRTRQPLVKCLRMWLTIATLVASSVIAFFGFCGSSSKTLKTSQRNPNLFSGSVRRCNAFSKTWVQHVDNWWHWHPKTEREKVPTAECPLMAPTTKILLCKSKFTRSAHGLQYDRYFVWYIK